MLRRAGQLVAGFSLGLFIVGLVLNPPPGMVLGALVGGVIGGTLQLTVMADYLRRCSLAYYEKRWAKQQAS